MPAKKGSGNFVKDAMTEAFLETGIDKIYKLSLTTTEQFEKTTGQTIRDLEPQIENRFVKMEVNLGHESVMKILKLLNPKRVNWFMGEPPTDEKKAKFGIKARWEWSEYDMKQLRLVSKPEQEKA